MVYWGEYVVNYQYIPEGPSINSIVLKGLLSATSSKFYTQTYDLDFNTQYILITAETDIPEGAIIRFGVTNLESTKVENYQFVELNRITKLNELSVTGKKFKLLIELSGNSSEEVIVHEFATMFSGSGQKTLNR